MVRSWSLASVQRRWWALLGVSVASTIGFVLDAARVTAEDGRTEAFRAHQEALVGVPDSIYRKDRAREVRGRALDETRCGVPAQIEIVDAERLAQESTACTELSALLDRDIPVERVFTCGPDGTFQWAEPTTGNKLIYASALGRAAVRRENLLICDGRVYPTVEMELPAERTARLRNSGRSSAEIFPLYSGWWPQDAWRVVVPTETISLEWRQPDGWPFGIAVRDASGIVSLRTLPTKKDSARVWDLEELPPLKLDIPVIAGAPVLAFSVRQAITRSLYANTGDADAMTATGGTLSVMAEMGFSSVSLLLQDGRRFMALADPYGQAVFHGLPEGVHLVKTSSFLAGDTYAKAVFSRRGAIDEITFYPSDRRATARQSVPAIAGVLTRGTQRCPGGFVYCQPSVRGRDIGPHLVRLDPDGRFREQPALPGAVYAFIYASSTSDQSVRHTRYVQVPTDVPEIDLGLDLEIPANRVHLPVPACARSGDRVIVTSLDGGAEVRRWAFDVPTGDSIVVQDLEPGTFQVQLEAGTAVRARSRRFKLSTSEDPAGQIEVAWESSEEVGAGDDLGSAGKEQR